MDVKVILRMSSAVKLLSNVGLTMAMKFRVL